MSMEGIPGAWFLSYQEAMWLMWVSRLDSTLPPNMVVSLEPGIVTLTLTLPYSRFLNGF